MKKILLIQSRSTSWWLERERKNFARAVGFYAKLEYLSALDEKLAWTYPDEYLKHYDGIIVGGSSDFDLDGGRAEKDPARIMALIILTRVKLILNYALAEEKPIFGVCFGHQLIAKMHGAEVTNDSVQSKFGSHDLQLTAEGQKDPLFNTFPAAFTAQYWHKDSVVEVPKGATLLATSPSCRFSALRYGDKVYTTQFHPEIEQVVPDKHPRPSLEASTLIPRWLEQIAAA